MIGVKPAAAVSARPGLSPSMRQSLEVLQMPLAELKTYLEKELESNPVLECTAPSEIILSGSENAEGPFQRSLPTLEAHLLAQAGLLPLSVSEKSIVREIIGNLDEDGYFRESLDATAAALRVSRRQAEKALAIVQSFEPKGVGARSLEECLLLQLKALPGTFAKQAGLIVEHRFADLTRKRFGKIARVFGISAAEVEAALRLVRRLDPKPGKSFALNEPVLLLPDVFVEPKSGKWTPRLNPRELPPLRINPYYRKLLADKRTPEEARRYLREKLQRAVRLLRAVKDRGRTVEKVARYVVERQADFFEAGAVALKPLTFEAAARSLGLHKSTVWRAATEKYVQTPSGILELKSFFSRRVRGTSEASTAAAKGLIRAFIAGEDRRRPLNDGQIAESLASRGVPVARRTVAKYREAMKILPAHLRRA